MTKRQHGAIAENIKANPILLGIGANVDSKFGSPTETILQSIRELGEAGLLVKVVSRLFQTPAFPPSAGSDYVNVAVLCNSDKPAIEILAILHRIEDKHGRLRHRRWDARTLDIDLLAVGDQILPDLTIHQEWRDLPFEQQKIRVPEQLILPHPRLQDRSFVLVPLADIAPNWTHPILRQSVKEMLAALPDASMEGIRVKNGSN